MAHGKKITLFLMDGDPNGRWTCELSNWTGKAYKIPRTLLKDCATRADLKQAGVYFYLDAVATMENLWPILEKQKMFLIDFLSILLKKISGMKLLLLPVRIKTLTKLM